MVLRFASSYFDDDPRKTKQEKNTNREIQCLMAYYHDHGNS